MKTRVVRAVTLTLAIMLVAVIPALAAEPIMSEHWMDQSGGTWNTCTDEWVQTTGAAHFLELVVQYEDGSGILEAHTNSLVSGVGETGTKYIFRQVSNEHSTHAFDYTPYAYTKVLRYQDIAQGRADDGVYWQTFHVTVNPDGTVTSEFDRSGWDCRSPQLP